MNVENVGVGSGAPASYCPQLAREQLDALNKVHGDLLASLGSKRRATRQTAPDPIPLCRARWNVSRASRNYRALVATILAELMTSASPGDLLIIISLQRAGVQQTQRTTRHVQEWDPERVMSNWREYCDASARIQADIEQRVQGETILITRMLKKHILA